MTPKRDALRKRLLVAGLTEEMITKYLHAFRAFLSARLTKLRFEDEMAAILPRDKLHVHNQIVQDILHAAQQRRDGLRDLPVLTPLRKQIAPRRQPLPSKPIGVLSKEIKTAKTGQKRPLDDSDSTTFKAGGTDEGLVKRQKRGLLKKSGEAQDKVRPTKSVIGKPSTVRHRGSGGGGGSSGGGGGGGGGVRGGDTTGVLVGTGPHDGTGSRGTVHHGVGTSAAGDVPTYDGLPYFPVRPGRGLDVDAFLKVRARMQRVAEGMGLGGVKDDAAALMVQAIEAHVKTMLDGAVQARVGRDGERPERNEVCGPVRGYDVREAALRNLGLLGDEKGMELERLLMLL